MFAKAFAATVALGLMTGFAHAADPDYAVQQTSTTTDWTGFFFGFNAGYVWGESTVPAGFPGSFSPDGGFAGIQGGYNYQFDNNVVVGAFVSAPIISAQDTTPAFGGTFQAEVKWAVAGGVRVGYAYGRFLPFVFAGVAVGRGDAQATFGALVIDPADNTHTGYTIGVGVDYEIHENWSIGARYAYTSLGTETYAFPAPAAVKFNSHSLSATVNYHF